MKFYLNNVSGGSVFNAFVALTALAGLLSGCATTEVANRSGALKRDVDMVSGPSVHENRTPVDGVLECFADDLVNAKAPRLKIGVGDVKDYTGKYSINEGNSISQGGALMVYSALGQMSKAVDLVERYDTAVGEKELGYTDRRQLGDGATHKLTGQQDQTVPWLPYYGGTILKSDYYIIGGITELNSNISSKGGKAEVDQMGPTGRTWRSNVAIDLRIVDSSTLRVVKTVSVEKQIVGYEVSANVFNFFGTRLFDINLGGMAQEPTQMAVRAALQQGVLELVSSVTHVDLTPCSDQSVWFKPQSTLRGKPTKAQVEAVAAHKKAIVQRGQAAESATHLTTPVPAAGGAAGVAINAGQTSTGSNLGVVFEYASTDLSAEGANQLRRVEVEARRGTVSLMVLARTAESFTPAQRRQLSDQRISRVIAFLQSVGIPKAQVQVTWQPGASDSAVTYDGTGMQVVGRLTIMTGP